MVDCMMFFKKKLTSDFVELSIGRLYFKEITHGTLNTITRQSTILGRTLNNALFLELFEYALVDLSRRKIRALTLKDGNKLRNKIKEILLRHDILEADKSVETPTSESDIFSQKNVEWFDRSRADAFRRAKISKQPNRSRTTGH